MKVHIDLKFWQTTTDTIVDDLSNTFVEEAVNSQIQISIDTTDPTATIEAVTGTQNAEFTVKVSFSESVNNVDISDFRFVLEKHKYQPLINNKSRGTL